MRRSKSKKASKNATTGTTSAAPTVNMRRSKSKKASKNATTGTTSAAPTVPAVSISELPNHITCDILSRLPLNSIFACKRVCKTWRDLTLEPYFAKLHLSSSPLSLIFYHNGNNNDDPLSSHFEIVQLHDPLGRWDATMKFRTEIYFPHMYVVASCNGSILLSNSSPNDYRIIVCNPLRAQHFILPNPPKLALQTHESVIRLGIGHSPRTNQYKVLRFTSTNGPARLYMYCDIFTIGIDDEWRSIVGTEQPPALIVSNFVFLNGALHWIGLEKSRFICYFDIEKEQFGSFPLPSHVGKSCNYLGVVDNRLYLHNDQSSTVWRSWALKDYGDFESWTLEWVIEEEPIILCFTGSIKPLKMLKDGSLLMMFNKTSARTRFTKTTLACYNPHTRVLKKNKYHLSGCWGAAVADIPCFFSPTDALK